MKQFTINKGINRSIEFKGIKAQYIIYLCIGVVILLLLFVILYIAGVNSYIGLAVVVPLGVVLYITIQKYSKKYGEHGLVKYSARQKMPQSIVTRSRSCFTLLSVNNHEESEKNGRRTTRLES